MLGNAMHGNEKSSREAKIHLNALTVERLRLKRPKICPNSRQYSFI